MKRYPPVPHVEDAPELFDGGHLWVQELLDGAHLRFRMRASGAIEFGDGEGPFRGEVPLAYEHAVRHVRQRLDREALRAAIDDVETVTFFAEAMHRQSLDYEFDRTPSVLGVDIWDDDREAFLPPDGVERVFERLGLRVVNTFQKEVRASDFDIDPEAIPESAWRDGPAAGVFIRNKTGKRGKLPNPEIEFDTDPEPLEATAEEVAARYVTDERLRRIATDVAERDGTVGFETLFDRVFEAILREIHAQLCHGQTTIEVREFRSAVAERTRAWLADRE